MKNFRTALLSFIFVLLLTNFSNSQISTFNYTGDVQTYLVPNGITSIQIEAFGAQGGGEYGGLGGCYCNN